DLTPRPLPQFSNSRRRQRARLYRTNRTAARDYLSAISSWSHLRRENKRRTSVRLRCRRARSTAPFHSLFAPSLAAELRISQPCPTGTGSQQLRLRKKRGEETSVWRSERLLSPAPVALGRGLPDPAAVFRQSPAQHFWADKPA